MSYIGNEPIVSATRTVTEISATAGQTTFTANGGYTVGKVDVIVNGSQLQSSDFTATNGSTVVLTSACALGDDVKLVAWGTFNTANVDGSTINNASITATKFAAGQTPSFNGIAFPATQSASSDANTLDDYEEGTWTPIDASGAGLTFSVTSAYYIKIGRLVFVNTYFSYPSTSNASSAIIGGLPFTAYGGNNYSYLYGRNNSGSNIVWQVGTASTTMVGNYPASAGNPTNASLSTSYILISGSYIALD